MKRTWPGYVLAYLMWIVVMALGLWFLVISRSGVLGALAKFYVGDSATRAWGAGFYDRMYLLAVGLLWLVLSVVIESYFRKGVRRRQLLRHFARVAGPESLLIFAADLFLLWLQGWSAGWLRWLILGCALLVGLLLVVFAWLPRASRHDGGEPGEALDSTRPA